MNLSFLEEKIEKIHLLIPILLVLLVFFIPISPSIKSILTVLSLLAIGFTPSYRQYLLYAFNTLWARAAIALFLYVLIACIWSKAPFKLEYNIINKYSKLIFLPIFAVGFIKPQARTWALNGYILSMLFTSVLSILKINNLFINDLFHSLDPGEVFYNHIVTGIMIALGVYFAGILLIQANADKWLRSLYLSMIVLGSYQIFFINSGRAGYIIYGVLMCLLIVQKFPLRKALIGLILFTSVSGLGFMLSPVMQDGAYSLVNDLRLLKYNQTDTSLGFRYQFHRYAKSLFKRHPILGVGTGGFQYNFIIDQPVPSWGHKLNEPHGQYWLTLAEFGLIGMALFLFFIGTLFITALKLKEMKPFLLGMLVSFCMLCFSDTIFCYSAIGYLLILFSALCFGELIEKKGIAYKKLIKDKFELNVNFSLVFWVRVHKPEESSPSLSFASRSREQVAEIVSK
ncbi:O-antigen ligase family protein [Legionella anisa]|uniref:O-antigen ligase family protein n=1 Tax=Legionella anisa TaxID=28082 RepID=UPI00034DDD8A|nr:O-antigen ligase family protein [Legionella anisa]KTC77571.1 O-antigen biosynthesis protein [Legionella anisa]MCW8425103.1 O-antigen ligase family protein [Legionella anisa]MCW8445781.1 O-antigen ligase family protein [Legionella anisa]